MENNYNSNYDSNYDSNNDSKQKRNIFFILLIIIIIIILSMRSCTRIEKANDLIPTGNVDIFDIVIYNICNCTGNCGCNGNCDENCTCSCNCAKTPAKQQSVIAKNYEQGQVIEHNSNNYTEPDKEPEQLNEALIDDADGRYSNSKELRIFSNPAYEFREMIAPTSTNVYQFVVRNNNDFNIKYAIIMSEENEYDINMRYRLKLDGEYVRGDSTHWVDYNELDLNDLKLASKSNNVYQLEWKWFESSNDTYVGEVADTYSLRISFTGVQI